MPQKSLHMHHFLPRPGLWVAALPEATRRHGVFALRCARRTALPAPLLQTAQTILAQQLPAHYPSACPRLTLCYLLCDVACTGCDHLRDGGELLSDHLRDGVQP